MADSRTILSRALVFVAVYVAGFLVWTAANVEQYLWLEPLALGAKLLTALVERPLLTSDVTTTPGWLWVTSVVLDSGNLRHFGLVGATFTAAVPILLALVCVAPGVSRTRRVRLLALALGALFVLNVAAATCLIEATYLRIGRDGASAMLAKQPLLAPLYRSAEKALGTYMAELAMVCVVFGLGFLASVDAGGTAGVTSRNEPCPCGSGKKFKRCCAA